MMRICSSFLLILCLALPARADVDAAKLARDASDALGRASVMLSSAERSSDRIKALTETIRAYEQGLAAMRESLRRAALEERRATEQLAGHDAELGDMLSLLQNVTRAGQAETLLHPGSAVDTVRAGVLASALVPALEERSNDLQLSLNDLTALRSLQEAGIATVETGLTEVRDARLKLSQAMSDRTEVPTSLATDEAAMEALINSSETLAAFADSLVADVGNAEELVSGGWEMPVIGQIIRGFDEADAAGIRRPGWIVETAGEALVSTPADATTRFSGSMPGHGLVVILETAPGQLMILAGLGKAFVQRGQIVAGGEPVGLMGGRNWPEQEKLIETLDHGGQPDGEKLYIEIRQGQAALDPKTILRPEEE